MKESLLDVSLEELEKFVAANGGQKFHAAQIKKFSNFGFEVEEISVISKQLREILSKSFVSNPVKIIQEIESKDGTKKFLFQLLDGNVIEGVLMSYHHGKTLCISSQVGCRMGCKFCASTLGGLVRNLSSSEILGQVLSVNRALGAKVSERRITNLVLMGSGEPLDNYENVVRFIKEISGPNSLNISQRNISLSTCGLVEKIYRLADDGLQITLTISLHAPNDEIRRKIMPVASSQPIEKLIESAKYYFEKTGRRVVFEYAMIDGVNNSAACAAELKKLLGGLCCHINLIPLNSVEERNLKGAPKHQVYWFKDKLVSLGLSATVRRTMGEDIEGACGQLRAKFLKNS